MLQEHSEEEERDAATISPSPMMPLRRFYAPLRSRYQIIVETPAEMLSLRLFFTEDTLRADERHITLMILFSFHILYAIASVDYVMTAMALTPRTGARCRYAGRRV